MLQKPANAEPHQVGRGQARFIRKLAKLAPVRRRQSDFKSCVALHTDKVRRRTKAATHHGAGTGKSPRFLAIGLASPLPGAAMIPSLDSSPPSTPGPAQNN